METNVSKSLFDNEFKGFKVYGSKVAGPRNHELLGPRQGSAEAFLLGTSRVHPQPSPHWRLPIGQLLD